MNDDERLRNYRPAGPPADLRARITASRSAKASAERSSLRDWLPALATAAVIALLYVAATEIRAAAYAKIVDSDALILVEAPHR
jgi:hypothetical protein